MKKVLCIDDDPIALMVIEICINKSSFAKEVIKKTSAESAIQFYESITHDDDVPDLIFLDLNMPVMNGWDFLVQFENDFPQALNKTKIIILSSSVDPDDKKKSIENKNVYKFIPKPINVDLLKEILLEL